MITKMIFVMSTFALAAASAATSYRVTLFEKSVINGTELKPGEYKLQVIDNKAVLKQGKTVAEAAVKVESTEQKISATSVKYVNGAIQEIRIGGTKTKLVFEN